ncbi:MAG: polyprenyl synthetase family protein [Planctomycetota bacterium]
MSSTLNSIGLAAREPAILGTTEDNCLDYWKEVVYGPLEDFLNRKGKRIRAELIEISFQLGGGQGRPPSQIIDFVELLHAGSLIIDDIQDNSRNRRQKEALHLTYGIPVAINTGNWLYFAALEFLTDLELPSADLMQITKKVLKVIKDCHEGQAIDLMATFDKVPASHMVSTVQQISHLKTGGLTGLAAWLGGVVASADEETCNRLALLGQDLGVGLQMQNDFVELQRAAVSRCSSDDLRNRRCTWPWAWLANSQSSDVLQSIAKFACDEMPNCQSTASRMLEKIEIIAVNQINQKLMHALNAIEKFEAEQSIKNRLNQIVTNLELHYV